MLVTHDEGNTMTSTAAALFRTANGQRLHIAECPYILGAEVLPAAVDDTREVCTWCQAELNEEGRTIHDSIEDALRDMGANEGNLVELARLLRSVAHDLIYVPFSRSYVAVALEGRPAAVAGKTYVWFRDGRKIELPGFVGTGGDKIGGDRSSIWGDTCPRTFMKHPINGSCDECQ
jgi:hypothetical protein